MKRFILYFLFVVMVLRVHAADAVPTSARGSWTRHSAGGVGVTGGIPDDTGWSQSGSTITSTGSDQASQINTAISSAPANSIILLGSGVFSTGSSILIHRNDVRLRGAGSSQITGEGSTIIRPTGSGYIAIDVGDGDWNHGTAVAISGTMTQGTTTLAVSSSSGFTVDAPAVIRQNNDTSTATLPVVNVASNGVNLASRAQEVRITAKPDATHVTISPGLAWTLSSGLSPVIEPATSYKKNVGIENLIIDQNVSTGSGAIINAWTTRDWWIKNVKTLNSDSYHITLSYCLNTEIVHTQILDSATHVSNGSGIRMYPGSSNTLIEDCIIGRVFPSIELNKGTCNTVIVGTYCFLSDYGDPSTQSGAAIDVGHDTHNSYTLVDNCVIQNLQDDAYFGSTSDLVVNHSWLYGTSTQTTQFWFCLALGRFSRHDYIVSNLLGTTGYTWDKNSTTNGVDFATHRIYVLGYPGSGNWSYSGTAAHSGGTDWTDWSAYVAGTYAGGPTGGFLQLDQNVATLNTFLNNWNAQDNAVPAGEALAGGQTVQDSYTYGSIPAYWGNRPWPCLVPGSGQPATLAIIPAVYRYLNNAEPPSAGGDTTPPVVTITAPTAGTTYSTTSTPLTSLAGTASDDVALSTITWANNQGGSGTATGTTSWSVASVTLQAGANVITVTATDTSSNTSTDTLTVTYTPPAVAAHPRRGSSPVSVAPGF